MIHLRSTKPPVVGGFSCAPLKSTAGPRDFLTCSDAYGNRGLRTQDRRRVKRQLPADGASLPGSRHERKRHKRRRPFTDFWILCESAEPFPVDSAGLLFSYQTQRTQSDPDAIQCCASLKRRGQHRRDTWVKRNKSADVSFAISGTSHGNKVRRKDLLAGVSPRRHESVNPVNRMANGHLKFHDTGYRRLHNIRHNMDARYLLQKAHVDSGNHRIPIQPVRRIQKQTSKTRGSHVTARGARTCRKKFLPRQLLLTFELEDQLAVGTKKALWQRTRTG